MPRLGAMLESATAVPLGLARGLVSGSKVRFTSGGYDLDLTYITDRIIAMGLPASSIEAAWRNSLSEVARFLHEKHPQRHRVYNLCDERDYDQSHFHAALHLPFSDHHPPSMDTLLLFVADARAWLLEDEQNVVAVHCKAGKGRTGVMIAALLMATRYPGCANAHDAIAVFRARRTRDGDACRNAGQIRYVHYYEEVFSGRTPPPRALRLVRIELRRKDAARGGSRAAARVGHRSALAAATPFVNAVRTSIDAASGTDAANPLSVASGSTVSLKLSLDDRAPIVLEPQWRAATARAGGAGVGSGAGPADSRSLAQLSAWFAAEPDAVLTAPLGGLEASADVKVTMAAQGALAMARVREKLLRLNFHCAYETLHTAGQGADAQPVGARMGERGGVGSAPADLLPGMPGRGVASGAGAEDMAAQEAAQAGAAGAAGVGASHYLLFDRDGLDDCRGFANLYEFELRIYVQLLP